MAKHRDDRGPVHGWEARGYSAAYEEDRPRAMQEFEDTSAKVPDRLPADDVSLKNPFGEFENPAPMPPRAQGISVPGRPEDVGQGDGSIDLQGHQGEGDQPGYPPPYRGKPESWRSHPVATGKQSALIGRPAAGNVESRRG